MSPGARLRAAIAKAGPAQAMAAHNALSARLVEEAGFEAIWASGFEVSAVHALPDAGFVSMTQHLNVVATMAKAVSAPIVADVDTGFGNATHLAYTVQQYEAAGAAAIVVEDKTFPKMTSLAPGGRQELVRTAEFQGKVEAAVAARANSDFVIVARTEALIAGLGVAEALCRAAAYEEAGADFILVHSKESRPDEVVTFAKGWGGRAKLVIVPTAYPMSVEAARALKKIGLVIYGNHAIRSCVSAMRRTFREIRAEGSADRVSCDIASVADIFALQGMAALKASEARYLR